MYPEAVPARPSATAKHRLILIALWLLFYASFTLSTPPLLDDADSVHAEVAREMLLRHDWVTLYANGIRYLEKAPLFYWTMAASMKVFGATTAASRLPLALAVLTLALLLEAFARRASPHPPAGLYAGLITLSSFGIFIFSRINIPDLLVCVLLTLALLAFHHTEPLADALPDMPSAPSIAASSRWVGPTEVAAPRLSCYTFAAACALNILTKGLIGLVFPLGIVALYLLLTRGLRSTLTRIRQLHPLESTAIFLAIAAPWHILIGLANPAQGHPGTLTFSAGHWQVPLPAEGNVHGWTWFYFVNEQLLRYLNLRVPRDYDTVPLALFLGLIFIWLMPWSAFLPSALARALPLRDSGFRNRLRTHTLTATERTGLLLVLWAALPLVFFSLSTRQEYYVLPALPPMILLIANLIAEPTKLEVPRPLQPVHKAWGPRTSAVRIATVLLLTVGTLAATACLVYLLSSLLLHTRSPVPGTDLSSLLQQDPANYALSFGHFLDLNARALAFFRLPLALTAIAFFGGTLAHSVLRCHGRPYAATLALAAGAFLFLFAAHVGLRTFAPTLTSYQLAEAIRPQLHPQDLIVLHGEYEAGSTLGFYLRRNDLHLLEGRSSNLWYGSFFPDAPKIFETRASLAQRWSRPQRIFLWQDPSDRDRPALTQADLPTPIYLLVSSGGKEILSNQPNR